MWRKSTLWLVGITALAGAAGCGDGGSSTIRVTWDIAYVSGQGTTCELANTPTVTLEAINLDTGAKTMATFACKDMFGVTPKVPSGFYRLNLSLIDTKGRAMAVVEYDQIETRRSGVTDVQMAPFDIQAWELQWVIQIEPAAGGPVRDADCPTVGADTVELTWKLGGQQPETVTFPCVAYGGISPAIGTGFYQAQVRLLAGAQELSNTGFMAVDVTEDPKSARIPLELAVRR